MRVRIKQVQEVGACSYCDKGEVRSDGMGLVYPYKEVVVISGYQSTSRLCFECADQIAEMKGGLTCQLPVL